MAILGESLPVIRRYSKTITGIGQGRIPQNEVANYERGRLINSKLEELAKRYKDQKPVSAEIAAQGALEAIITEWRKGKKDYSVEDVRGLLSFLSGIAFEIGSFQHVLRTVQQDPEAVLLPPEGIKELYNLLSPGTEGGIDQYGRQKRIHRNEPDGIVLKRNPQQWLEVTAIYEMTLSDDIKHTEDAQKTLYANTIMFPDIFSRNTTAILVRPNDATAAGLSHIESQESIPTKHITVGLQKSWASEQAELAIRRNLITLEKNPDMARKMKFILDNLRKNLAPEREAELRAVFEANIVPSDNDILSMHKKRNPHKGRGRR
jgi:hypothetical protein